MLKSFLSLLVSILPSCAKVLLYRHVFGYQIGRHVKIGFGVVFLGVKRCRIGDQVCIRHLNLFNNIADLQISDHVYIGFCNLFRGGQTVQIGAYATIMRANVFNSIPEPDAVNPTDPVLQLGTGVVITTGHWLDFSDRITVGEHTVIGGRNSSFWTHNRQRTRPISFGQHCYVGSEVRVAPGVDVAPFCIIALGSVLMGQFPEPRSLIVGNPAAVQRALNERDLFLVTRKTRNDMPDELSVQP